MEVWHVKFVANKRTMMPPKTNLSLIEFFLQNPKEDFVFDASQLATAFGIRLVEYSKSRFDQRNHIASSTGKTWALEAETLAWGSYLTLDGLVSRWDITTDGSMVCHRKTFVDYIFYSVECLSDETIQSIQETKVAEQAEAEKREALKNILTTVLIEKMYPFGKLESGELETQYGVHLKQTDRNAHRFMRYKPGDQHKWVVNKSLHWGSSTGWDITQDGKVACCRINYDDYVNFDIEILSADEIESYKASAANKQLVSRLATLQEMYDQSLIDAEEFASKKQALLNLI